MSINVCGAAMVSFSECDNTEYYITYIHTYIVLHTLPSLNDEVEVTFSLHKRILQSWEEDANIT